MYYVGLTINSVKYLFRNENSAYGIFVILQEDD